MLTYACKGTRKAVVTNNLHQYSAGSEGFVLQIVIGDETWIYHCEPIFKRQSMEYDIPKKKKFNSVPSTGKIMITVLWYEKGVILMNFLRKRTTLNCDQYIEILRSLNANLH